jgi:glycosidase
MYTDNSIFNTVKNLIKMRGENPALQAEGNFVPVFAEDRKYPFVYFRSAGKNNVLVAINPSDRPASATFKLPKAQTFVELKMVKGIRLRENKGVFTLKMDGLSYGIFSC